MIPAAYRIALNLKPGDSLITRLERDEIRLSSVEAAIRWAQEIVRRDIPEV